MTQNILLVDDDPNILQGYSRQFRKKFRITTAPGGKEGLEAIHNDGPFAVIVSDMRMPNMDGAHFLTTVRQISPDSIRMMLTGNADQKTAMQAVNDGHIFRFLTKPCSPETFTKALEAGLEQYRLITAERELLSKTLSGSVSVLTEILSLVNPTAFGHAASIRRLVGKICQEVHVDNTWEIEIAAMLSQVGCVTLPESTLAKYSAGASLSGSELRTYQDHPRVGHDLIAKIPRLQGVAKIIASQQKCFDGSGMPNDGLREDQIPLGSRVLKLVIDVVQLVSAGKPYEEVFSIIREREGVYDPSLVIALADALDTEWAIKSVEIKDLEDDMVLDEHVMTKLGDILVACGGEVTSSLRERLKQFSTSITGVQEPIRVRCPIRRLDVNNTKTVERDVVLQTEGG